MSMGDAANEIRGFFARSVDLWRIGPRPERIFVIFRTRICCDQSAARHAAGEIPHRDRGGRDRRSACCSKEDAPAG
jgi:hypothetical protein